MANLSNLLKDQFKGDKGDTGDVSLAGTETLTNKRINPRIVAAGSFWTQTSDSATAGSGGGGGGTTGSAASTMTGTGGQGIVVFTYDTSSTPSANSGFFFLFG